MEQKQDKMHINDAIETTKTLLGPTREDPVLEPLAVLHLDTWL